VGRWWRACCQRNWRRRKMLVSVAGVFIKERGREEEEEEERGRRRE
jgi:hypothetical protein